MARENTQARILCNDARKAGKTLPHGQCNGDDFLEKALQMRKELAAAAQQI
jgi:hypothetical protein